MDVASDAAATGNGVSAVGLGSNSQIPITGGGPELKQFDQIMQTLMGNYSVPGGALAIAKNGKLVLARGYGYADLQNGRLFTPTTFLSLASVTKAVTGVAVLRLVDEGRLNLDDTLYNVLGKPKLGNLQDRRVMTSPCANCCTIQPDGKQILLVTTSPHTTRSPAMDQYLLRRYCYS